MDNLLCHNGQKPVDAMRRNHMIRLDHPPYLTDLTRVTSGLLEF
jgi:hypothetical protein